jgi:hypothetical protein
MCKEMPVIPVYKVVDPKELSRSAFFDEKSIPFHEQFPCSP